jgi:hypothetical protein
VSELKEDMNKQLKELKENSNKKMNKNKKTMQDMKEEINKDIKILKNNQSEINSSKIPSKNINQKLGEQSGTS